MVVLLIMLIMTITAISNNVTEMHYRTYIVVILLLPSAPQLSQHIPTDGALTCNKTADRRDSCSTTGAHGVTVTCSNIVAVRKPSDKCSY